MRKKLNFGLGSWWDPSRGKTSFRVWAPYCEAVRVELWQPGHPYELVVVPLHREKSDLSDYWVVTTSKASVGTHYRYRLQTDLGGKFKAPDPCSRWQPQGPDGFGVILDPNSYHWPAMESNWVGPECSWDLGPICELHVGTFTSEGTFDAIDDQRLQNLADSGFRSIQLMPVNCYPGNHNWGYDPSLLFSPAAAYGSPHQLRALVARAHSKGLFMGLDVVYNHFGPEMNFHGWFGPYQAEGKTPWGPGIATENPEVERFICENAVMWVNEYHFDFLRLDQTHLVADEALRAIGDAVRSVFSNARVIAEDFGRRLRMTRPVKSRGLGFDAQWNFQFHHVLMGHLFNESMHGLPHDNSALHAILDRGILNWEEHEGVESVKGDPSLSSSMVNYIASHDEIGNRGGHLLGDPGGERLSLRLNQEEYKLALALLLFSPGIPMLFMGDEYGEEAPFSFFADMSTPPVTSALRRSRPNALAPATFRGSRLHGETVLVQPEKRELREWFRALASLRQSETMTRLSWDRITVRDSRRKPAVPVFSLMVKPPHQAAEGKRVWALFNLGEHPFQSDQSNGVPGGDWMVVLASSDATLEGHSSQPDSRVVRVPPKGVLILIENP